MSRPRLLLSAIVLVLGGCAASGEPSGRRNAESPRARASELQVRLGQGYMEQGQYEIAHGKLKRALELDPASIDAHTVMAILYERIDRASLSEKHYRRAAELAPEDGSTNNNLGTFLCRTQRYDEADTYFRRAVNDPFYSTPQAAYSNAGLCAARANKPELAESYFRKALETDPRDVNSLYEMAVISFDKSDFMRARAFLQRYEAVGTVGPAMLDLAARIEDRLGDAAAAAKYRERLKTEFPDYEPGTVTGGSNSP